MSFKQVSIVLLVLLGTSLCLQDWRVAETSDAHFNEIMNKFNDVVLVHPESEDKFHVTGGCNECTLTSGSFDCTQRQCFREAPSEKFVSKIVAAPKNFKRLATASGNQLVLFGIYWAKSDSKITKHSLKVDWIRFIKYEKPAN